jgi:hypothetical protein
MKTAYLQWITLPVSISCYCFVCTQLKQIREVSISWKTAEVYMDAIIPVNNNVNLNVSFA